MGTGPHCSGPDPPGHTQRVYAHLLCELFLGQPRSAKLLNQPLNLTLTAPTPAHASIGKHPPSSPPSPLSREPWGWAYAYEELTSPTTVVQTFEPKTQL